MKKQIHELKMKLYEWRKKKIEEKYFKTFPERKGRKRGIRMTVYKPMTPRLRNQIDDAYRKQMQELDECENTPYVQFLRNLYGVQRNFLQSLPDGYLIPFTDESKR